MVQNKHLDLTPLASVEHENFANIRQQFQLPVRSLQFAVCSLQSAVSSPECPQTNTPDPRPADRTHAKSVVHHHPKGVGSAAPVTLWPSKKFRPEFVVAGRCFWQKIAGKPESRKTCVENLLLRAKKPGTTSLGRNAVMQSQSCCRRLRHWLKFLGQLCVGCL